MHGDISNPGQTVLIKDDYEKYFLTNQAFITALTGDLISKTFLFVGFSFSDPNIDYVLSRIRTSYVKNMRTHYCFIKRLDKTDFADSDTLAYRRRQQDLFIGDLKVTAHGVGLTAAKDLKNSLSSSNFGEICGSSNLMASKTGT